MALRWVAGGFLEAVKSFRRIDGANDLWVVAIALGRAQLVSHIASSVR